MGRRNIILIVFVSCMVFMWPFFVLAQTMTSTNYKVQSGSTYPGGETSSTNYFVREAVGEWQDVSTSTNRRVYAGFLGTQPDGALTATISQSSLDFGDLSVTSVSEVSLTVTVTTDSPSGYNLRVNEDGNLRDGNKTIDDVSDSSVTAGAEEYGLRTSGAAGSFNNSDTNITGDYKTIASATDPVASQSTTVTFKASIEGATEPGSYSHIVTLAAVANF